MSSRMDLETFLISIVIFIVLALLIWLITSLTVRERPFEERLEEQRKMEQALMLHGGKQAGMKKDKQKKKNKKLKSGERDGVESGSEKTENLAKTKTTKMVELEIDPEVIETSLSEPPVSIMEKKAKTGKPSSPPLTTVKPILLNKEEKSNVRKTEKATELVHHGVPKDDLELKHDREGKKFDMENKMATAAINGFHSESADSFDDLPSIADRSPANKTKATEVRYRKRRPELDTLAGDGGVSRVANVATEAQFSADRPQKRSAVSNDVTVSGTIMTAVFNYHLHASLFVAG